MEFEVVQMRFLWNLSFVQMRFLWNLRFVQMRFHVAMVDFCQKHIFQEYSVTSLMVLILGT